MLPGHRTVAYQGAKTFGKKRVGDGDSIPSVEVTYKVRIYIAPKSQKRIGANYGGHLGGKIG